MELLKSLYEIHSPSGGEKKMLKFIKSWIKTNVPGCKVWQDQKNLYVIKGEAETYPCVVAHTDQVQSKHSKDFKCYRHGDILFAFSATAGEQQGLGADDKNGIWVALKCLRHFDNIKCAFFREEEVGCVGSSLADMKFFDDCRFVLQADRRNGNDFITNASWTELCSEEFINDSGYRLFGYKEADGMLTDVLTLKENGLKVSCANISCGYYNPHTDKEVTNWSELQNCLAFVIYIITNCTKVYPHEEKYLGSLYKYSGFGKSSKSCGWYSTGGSSFNFSTPTKEDRDYEREMLIDEVINILYEETETYARDYNFIPTKEDLWYAVQSYGYEKDIFEKAYEDFHYCALEEQPF